MSVIPFTLIGVIFGHWITGFDITILSLVAIFGLAGIVINDSIIMISNILNKFIIKFSLPNFVAGGAIAGLIGYLTLSAVPTVSTLTHMNAGFELKKPEMERIERILGNQPANLPKLKKEIESLIVEKSTPAIDNNSVKLKSANSSHVIKIENNLVQINKIDDCLVIKILNSSNDSTNYICQNENNEWKFQNK